MRGDGSTTRQMQAAPKDALFVWVNGHLDYPKMLAKELGREDLKIVAPSFLDYDQWRGIRYSGVVVDHAAHLNDKQIDSLYQIEAHLRPTEGDRNG